MKILVAPDSFKGSLSASRVAHSIQLGILKAMPHAIVERVPISDGGEGLVDCLVDGTGGRIKYQDVLDPLLRKVRAHYGILKSNIAVIEMAAASGLDHLQINERQILTTSTFGTGQLLKAALDEGCRKIIIGLGGSATNDGGIGMASALGCRFLDADGVALGPGGGTLGGLAEIDVKGLDSRIEECEFIAACDVENPLTGANGATFVYGPQKGGSHEDIRLVEDNLHHYSEMLRTQLGVDLTEMPGAGAAGGLGAGLVAFLGARLERGMGIVSDLLDLEARIADADMIFTGEGKVDEQTLMGKAPSGILSIARKYGKPVVLLGGVVEIQTSTLMSSGASEVHQILEPGMDMNYSIENAPSLLEQKAMKIVENWLN